MVALLLEDWGRVTLLPHGTCPSDVLPAGPLYSLCVTSPGSPGSRLFCSGSGLGLSSQVRWRLLVAARDGRTDGGLEGWGVKGRMMHACKTGLLDSK